MTAHYNNCLPHEEQKKSADERKYKYADTESGYLSAKCQVIGRHFINEDIYQRVVSSGVRINACYTEVLLQYVENKTCYLWGENGKIIRKYNEDYTEYEPKAILPEIFIECLKMLHLCEGTALSFHKSFQVIH